MKEEKEVKEKLRAIEETLNDLGRKPVLVHVNAPVALMQVDLLAKENTLKWVLGKREQ